MMKNTPPRKQTEAHGPRNLCLECRLFILNQCRWIPGEYCKITKSRT